MSMYFIKTPRLGLRNWIDADIPPMAEMNKDKEVRRYFPNTANYKETTLFVERMQQHFDEHGFCYFAVDLLETNELIGFIGLCYQDYESDFTPHVDIGWRLARKFWGKGFATEGAKACLEFAFSQVKMDQVYAVAPAINLPSLGVMQKIGMEKINTFDHPLLLDDDRLRECVLYCKKAGEICAL